RIPLGTPLPSGASSSSSAGTERARGFETPPDAFHQGAPERPMLHHRPPDVPEGVDTRGPAAYRLSIGIEARGRESSAVRRLRSGGRVRRRLSAIVLAFALPITLDHAANILFDATKHEMAGNADWVADADAFDLNLPAFPCTGSTNESNPSRFPTP